MKHILILALCFFGLKGYAQETTRFTEVHQSFKQGVDFYEKGLFDLAQQSFEKTISLTRQVNDPGYTLINSQAQLLHAQSGVRLGKSSGEQEIIAFARQEAPAPVAQEALLEIGNFYYNEREYKKAIDMYERIDQNALSKELREEVTFKLGYTNFVSKRFGAAERYFRQVKENENQYYYPSNYYYGMTQFFKANYEEAILHFQRVRNSRKYDDYIPYYITQIYSARGEYDNVIKYAEPLIKKPGLRKATEMNQLLGQAYFETGDYESALPYFDAFASKSNSFRPEDYYQLGYVYYQTGDYEKAINNFEQLSNLDNKLGQNAVYNLADAYLKLDEKASARNAMGQVARMKHDAKLQEEANFYYGKLSYELNADRESLNSLLAVKSGSPHYQEAQILLSNLFLRSRDYANATETLGAMKNRTPKLNETYQQVLYLRGLQLLQDDEPVQAVSFLEKSLDFPMNNRTTALAHFWLADVAHTNRQYDVSINNMNAYFDKAKSYDDLPETASLFVANYVQGYNYLKKDNHSSALRYFEEVVADITRNQNDIQNEYVKNQLLGDATLRAGDAHFKQNRYDAAVRYYDNAIEKQYSGFVYALYQKAIIEGLRGNETDKIVALEQIANNYPSSGYADEALLQLGATYQSMNRLEQAKAPLRRLVTEFKGKTNLMSPALLRLGLITYNQGDPNAALAYYREVFENNPSAEEAQSALKAVEEIYVDDLNDPEGYIDFLATIPGYNVDSAEKESISFQAAEAQYENGNYQNAIAAFTRYLQKYPQGRYSLPAHYYRGESNAVLKQYSQALADYEYVVARGVSNFYTKALRKAAIIAEVYEKNYRKSFDLYQRMEAAALTDEERFEAQLGAMESAYKAELYSEASQLAQRVSTNALATDEQKGTAYFYIAKVAQQQKDYTRAKSAYQQTIALSQDEHAAESRYQIAHMAYMQRDLNTAKDLSMQAARESAAYPYWIAKSLILQSDILAEQGDTYNAKAILEGLLENFDEDPELVAEAQQKLARLQEYERGASRLNLTPEGEDGLLEMEED